MHIYKLFQFLIIVIFCFSCSKTNIKESLIEEKVKHLNLRLIKKLKKDSVIVLKKDFK